MKTTSATVSAALFQMMKIWAYFVNPSVIVRTYLFPMSELSHGPNRYRLRHWFRALHCGIGCKGDALTGLIFKALFDVFQYIIVHVEPEITFLQTFLAFLYTSMAFQYISMDHK
jgi:hypothetical protein